MIKKKYCYCMRNKEKAEISNILRLKNFNTQFIKISGEGYQKNREQIEHEYTGLADFYEYQQVNCNKAENYENKKKQLR